MTQAANEFILVFQTPMQRKLMVCDRKRELSKIASLLATISNAPQAECGSLLFVDTTHRVVRDTKLLLSAVMVRGPYLVGTS